MIPMHIARSQRIQTITASTFTKAAAHQSERWQRTPPQRRVPEQRRQAAVAAAAMERMR
jgi:hypothetical protein